MAGFKEAAKAVLLPAAHTCWQTFAATTTGWWVSSGAGAFHGIDSVSTADRFVTTAAVAVGAAALSALKTTALSLRSELADEQSDAVKAIDAAFDTADKVDAEKPASGT